jgi:mRNA-degrading endonuclease RelE of RelBE toxin-antitoxin system
MGTKEIIKRISKLPPKKQARVLSFVQLVENEPEDDEIYEELAPEFEDALIRRLSFAQGAWDDE